MKILSGALAIVFVGAAFAHDMHGNPNWIAKGEYRSPIDGSHCCGVADCVQVDADDVREVRGGLSLRGRVTYGIGKGSTHQWLDEFVPQKEVQPSLDGNYWRCKKPDGVRRCFFAPFPPA